MWVCKLTQRILLLGIASKLERWIISPCHHNWRPYRSGNNLHWSSPHCHQHSHSSNWTSHVHNGSKTVQGSVWSWETQKRKWKSYESKRCSLMSIGWSGSCCCRYTKKIGVWFQGISWVIRRLEKKRWSISFLKKILLKIFFGYINENKKYCLIIRIVKPLIWMPKQILEKLPLLWLAKLD